MNQTAGLQIGQQRQNVILDDISGCVVFLRNRCDDLRHGMLAVAKVPNSAAYLIQRKVISVIHIEQQEVGRGFLGDHLISAPWGVLHIDFDFHELASIIWYGVAEPDACVRFEIRVNL
jgi:hypothetical protein